MRDNWVKSNTFTDTKRPYVEDRTGGTKGVRRRCFRFGSKRNRTTPCRNLALAIILLLGSPTFAFAHRAISPAPHGISAEPALSLASHRAVYAISLVRATQ